MMTMTMTETTKMTKAVAAEANATTAAEATVRTAVAAAAAAAKATARATAATTEVVSWWYGSGGVRGSGSYDCTNYVFLQIHFLCSILRRPHTDRISEWVKKVMTEQES